MTNIYTCNFSEINLYKSKNIKSEVVTQMIYGDRFSVIDKSSKWLKIKILEDKYKGFILNKNYNKNLKPTHKVGVLKAKIYSSLKKKSKFSYLTFNSKITILKKYKEFYKFDKGWIKKNDVRPINFKKNDFFSGIKIFKNVKYKWGGKTFRGVDCSALVQLWMNYNNKSCPRDASDQEKYFRKNYDLKNVKKNDLIYWKGHVAIVLSKKKLIHAYGPKKKTVIMDINKTIKRIKKSANLSVTSIKRVK